MECSGDMKSADMSLMFETIKKDIEFDRQLREELRDTIRGLDNCGQEMLSKLQRTYVVLRKDGVCAEFEEVRQLLENQVKVTLQKVVEKVAPSVYYKYNDIFRFVMQRWVFVLLFSNFLDKGELMTHRVAATVLGLNHDPKNGFHLDLEDYLFGVLNFASELSRYAVNSVTAGDRARPFQIAAFLTELDRNFRLLNFKNGELRRRFDVLKYDVQRADQVIYDLTIRGIKPPEVDQ